MSFTIFQSSFWHNVDSTKTVFTIFWSFLPLFFSLISPSERNWESKWVICITIFINHQLNVQLIARPSPFNSEHRSFQFERFVDFIVRNLRIVTRCHKRLTDGWGIDGSERRKQNFHPCGLNTSDQTETVAQRVVRCLAFATMGDHAWRMFLGALRRTWSFALLLWSMSCTMGTMTCILINSGDETAGYHSPLADLRNGILGTRKEDIFPTLYRFFPSLFCFWKNISFNDFYGCLFFKFLVFFFFVLLEKADNI